MQDDTQDDVAFALAFNEALGGASTDEDSGADDAASPTDQAEEPQGAEPVATTPSSVEGEPSPPAPAFDEYKAQMEELARQNRELAAQLQEMKTPKAEAPPVQQEQKPAEVEDADFKAFAEEWPEVARAMAQREAALKAQVQELMQALIAPVKQELLQSVQPVVQQYQQTEEERFLNTIKSQHPDALELLPEVEKWAATLPSYLKVGVDYALSKGTAEDVIALYNSFKKETGRARSAASGVDEVTRQRMKKMGAVSASRPASPTAQADTNDFDGAFAQAAAELSR